MLGAKTERVAITGSTIGGGEDGCTIATESREEHVLHEGVCKATAVSREGEEEEVKEEVEGSAVYALVIFANH